MKLLFLLFIFLIDIEENFEKISINLEYSLVDEWDRTEWVNKPDKDDMVCLKSTKTGCKKWKFEDIHPLEYWLNQTVLKVLKKKYTYHGVANNGIVNMENIDYPFSVPFENVKVYLSEVEDEEGEFFFDFYNGTEPLEYFRRVSSDLEVLWYLNEKHKPKDDFWTVNRYYTITVTQYYVGKKPQLLVKFLVRHIFYLLSFILTALIVLVAIPGIFCKIGSLAKISGYENLLVFSLLVCPFFYVMWIFLKYFLSVKWTYLFVYLAAVPLILRMM